MAVLTDEELDRLEGALRLQFQAMGYHINSEAELQGQFSIFSVVSREWWVVTFVGECEDGDIELARHYNSRRNDRLGYFELADPACFDKMKAHIDQDNTSSR